MTTLNKNQIIDLLPHREPMLLIDELYDIKKLHSASAVVNAYKQLNTANKKKVEGMLADQGKFKQFVSFAMQASK